MTITENMQKVNPPRAGVIPYYITDNDEIMIKLMIPSNIKYGGSEPQIPKGRVDQGEDIRDGAVREAEEEVGLKQANISHLRFIGNFKMKKYNLHIWVAQIKDPEDFDKPHYETGWAGWMKIIDAVEKTRLDQKKILEHVNFLLQ